MDLAEHKEAFIIALTETHLSDNISSSEITREGWDVFRADRHSRYGGGVAIYIKQSSFTISTDMCEALGLYLPLSNTVIITIYYLRTVN